MLLSLAHAPAGGGAPAGAAPPTAAPGPAGADCAKPPRAPVMPQGATATDEEMKAGHDALQKYVLILETYQSCMEQRVRTAPADTKPEIRQQWQALADAAIDAAHEIADVYSIQLRAFKARQ
jgi:hypothetical protein